MSYKEGRLLAETAEREARFRALFDAHHRAILGYALRRSSSASDAAEVMADTMLVAWRRLESVPPGDTARMWLYGVAHKVLANQSRGNARRDRLVEQLAAAVEHVLPDVGAVTAEQLWIRAALADLPAADREVLMLTAWEGLSPTDIAGALCVPASTVRTRLHRARARLRAELAATAADSSPVGTPEEVA